MGSTTLPKDLFQHVLCANKPGFAEKFSLHVIGVSEVCMLVFRQDYVTLSLYRLFMVSNDILIQSKDFTTWKVKTNRI